MKKNRYALLAVLIAGSILAGGCGIDSSGIPDACWLTGLCSNPYTAANGWNNCPAGWQPVFKAGNGTYGYSGYASYYAITPSGDPILGPDGNPEVIVPNPKDPSSLSPIAYCIGPGYQPPWPYIPATGSCQPPAIAYVQGTFDYCPNPSTAKDCVCVPPGVNNAPTPTIMPSPTPLVLLPYPVEVDPYCAVASPAPAAGAVQVWTPNTHDLPSDSFVASVVSGPNWAITQSKGPLPLNAPYHPGLDSTTFFGPPGVKFTYKLCYPADQNTCGQYEATYGTCAGKTTSPGGSTGCAQPKGGCPSGQFWNGAPQCSCTTIK